jgi:hypothetical protein
LAEGAAQFSQHSATRYFPRKTRIPEGRFK